MGYQYSVDPAKMEIEGSSFIPSTSDTGPTLQHTSPVAKEREESATSAASSENEVIPSTSACVKRGCSDVRGKESRKKKRGKSDEANAKDQGRPGGVVEYQYTRKKIDKIPQNTPNSSKYTQK